MDHPEVMADLFSALVASDAFHLQAKLDVLRNRQPGKQAELLKDKDAAGGRPLDQFVVNSYGAQGRALQPRNDVKKRRFATPRWAHDAHEFVCSHLEVNVVERQQSVASRGGIAQRHFTKPHLGIGGQIVLVRCLYVTGAYFPRRNTAESAISGLIR